MRLSEVLAEIRMRVNENNLIDSCDADRRDGECEVDMTDVPSERVIVHAEREFELRDMEGKRADRLLFFPHTDGNALFVVPIELEGGSLRERRVAEQLQGGANLAEDLVPRADAFEIIFRAVAFSGMPIHYAQRRRLRRYEVAFRNLPSKQIRTAQCGVKRSLADALFREIPENPQVPLDERSRLREVPHEEVHD